MNPLDQSLDSIISGSPHKSSRPHLLDRPLSDACSPSKDRGHLLDKPLSSPHSRVNKERSKANPLDAPLRSGRNDRRSSGSSNPPRSSASRSSSSSRSVSSRSLDSSHRSWTRSGQDSRPSSNSRSGHSGRHQNDRSEQKERNPLDEALLAPRSPKKNSRPRPNKWRREAEARKDDRKRREENASRPLVAGQSWGDIADEDDAEFKENTRHMLNTKEKPNPTPEKSSMQGGPAKSPSKGKREFKKRKMIEKQKAHAIKITKNKMRAKRIDLCLITDDNERTIWTQRILNRQRAINIVKNSEPYQYFAQICPKSTRHKYYPTTPDALSSTVSNRGFKGLISSWRTRVSSFVGINGHDEMKRIIMGEHVIYDNLSDELKAHLDCPKVLARVEEDIIEESRTWEEPDEYLMEGDNQEDPEDQEVGDDMEGEEVDYEEDVPLTSSERTDQLLNEIAAEILL